MGEGAGSQKKGKSQLELWSQCYSNYKGSLFLSTEHLPCMFLCNPGNRSVKSISIANLEVEKSRLSDFLKATQPVGVSI